MRWASVVTSVLNVNGHLSQVPRGPCLPRAPAAVRCGLAAAVLRPFTCPPPSSPGPSCSLTAWHCSLEADASNGMGQSPGGWPHRKVRAAVQVAVVPWLVACPGGCRVPDAAGCPLPPRAEFSGYLRTSLTGSGSFTVHPAQELGDVKAAGFQVCVRYQRSIRSDSRGRRVFTLASQGLALAGSQHSGALWGASERWGHMRRRAEQCPLTPNLPLSPFPSAPCLVSATCLSYQNAFPYPSPLQLSEDESDLEISSLEVLPQDLNQREKPKPLSRSKLPEKAGSRPRGSGQSRVSGW